MEVKAYVINKAIEQYRNIRKPKKELFCVVNPAISINQDSEILKAEIVYSIFMPIESCVITEYKKF